MRKNKLLASWRRDEGTVGCWLSLGNTHSAELLANAGFDWLCIDMQHGLLDYQDLLHMLPAISTTETVPLARVSGNDPREIMKALDAGVMGVIVPLVNNRAEAEAAVSACMYPPDGSRSFGPARADLYCGGNYATEANGEIACIAMIETREGLDNLEEIVKTPNLAGIYIGPSDLGFAIGLGAKGDTDHPEHVKTVTRIREVCKAHGMPVGIHASSADYTAKHLAAGFNFVPMASDSLLMMQAARRDLAMVRGEQEKRGGNPAY